MTDRRDPSPHNELVRFWCDRYKEHVGFPYPFAGGKDGATIKQLRTLYSDDQLRTFIAAFFEMEDEFISNSGYSLGVFRGCLPKVIAFVSRGLKRETPKNLQGIAEWIAKRGAESA